MNINKFIDKINQKKINDNLVFCTQYRGVNIYFSTLKYFASFTVTEGIIIFWDNYKIVISPKFSKQNNICSDCFLEQRENFKYTNFFEENATVVEIDDDNLYKEKILYSISELMETLINKPLFEYFIIEDYQIKRLNFFRLSCCSRCINKIEQKHYSLSENTIVKASFLRKNINDYSKFIQLNNKDTGIFRTKKTTLLKNSITVELQYSLLNNEIISGIGIDKSYRKAKSKAFLEAMERYSGIFSVGQPIYKFSINELIQSGRDFFNPNDYFKFINKTKISDNRKINWLLSNDYGNKVSTLIPEDFVIYKSIKVPENQKIINMSSNGHAIGNSYKEAVIFSLFEMYERDSFLYHWYIEKTPKEINQETLDDKEIQYYIKMIKKLDYDISIYQLFSNDFISIYWTFARGKNINKFATYSTAGAHLFAKTAMISAIKELYFALYAYDDEIKYIKERAYSMEVKDIETVADHAIYYSIESRAHNFKFLNATELVDLILVDDYEVDVEKYYFDFLNFTKEKFGDIYIINNTPIGLREIGLYEIKVFIPYMQDMNFGYKNQFINSHRITEIIDIDNKIHPFP